MEDKQEKKQEPEFKGKMGTVWLVGILVIILGCVTVYTFKLVNENKKLKQLPPEPQTVAKDEEQKEEPAKVENITSEEKKETTNSTTTEKTTYTFSELEGVYVHKEKTKIEGEIVYNNHRLELYKDGTYDYSNGIDSVEGHLGNYIITDNKIILNTWFSYGSDIGRYYSDNSITYDINKDGSIGKLKKNKDKLHDKTGKQSIKSAIQCNAISIEGHSN